MKMKEKIKLAALLTVAALFSFCMALRAEQCAPSVLNVIQKFDAHTYEARVGGSWPVILTTQVELTHNGTNVLFVKKTGSKNLPTVNGFSQEYVLLTQCPRNDKWGENQ